MATDVEISRALNALTTTFNDHRTATFDADRAQEIVTGALGGECNLLIFAEGALAARVVDTIGHRVARVEHTGTRWTARRERTMGGSLVPQPDG
jgi:hypothetical protein